MKLSTTCITIVPFEIKVTWGDVQILLLLERTWGSRSGGSEALCILDYNTVYEWYVESLLTFRTTISPQSSGLKIKPGYTVCPAFSPLS
jgi:hypothetical protein